MECNAVRRWLEVAGMAHGGHAGRYGGAWQRMPWLVCGCWVGQHCVTVRGVGVSSRLA